MPAAERFILLMSIRHSYRHLRSPKRLAPAIPIRASLTIVVGFLPGGGSDTYGRNVARYIGKYILGNLRCRAKHAGSRQLNCVRHLDLSGRRTKR